MCANLLFPPPQPSRTYPLACRSLTPTPEHRSADPATVEAYKKANKSTTTTTEEDGIWDYSGRVKESSSLSTLPPPSFSPLMREHLKEGSSKTGTTTTRMFLSLPPSSSSSCLPLPASDGNGERRERRRTRRRISHRL